MMSKICLTLDIVPSKQDVISTEITIRKLEYDLAREIEMKKRVEAYREKQREKNKGDNEGASKQDDPGNDSASTGTSQVDEDDEELQRFLLEYDRKTFEDYDRESVLEILARAAAFCTVRMRQLPSE